MYLMISQIQIYLVVVFYLINSVMGGFYQRRLLQHLLTEQQYNPFERPVENDSQTLSVTINMALQEIVDFDGKNQIIVTSGWLVLTWHDYSLKWKPEEYGNIQTLRIPSTQIWTPDILLYNSADEKFDNTMKVSAVVQHTGDVLYVPPGIFKSICPFNIASFPFDTQTCTLKFGSWTHDESGINLTAESNKGQLDAYIKNTEWNLEEFSATNDALKYDCCPTLYPFVLFTIRIRRRSLYYVTNVVVPCFLISCMTILGFLLAPDSGEKLTLQITILLSVITFSLLISDIMPPSSMAIPLITIYFLCVMSMSTISVTASVLVISLHFRNARNYTMPLWIQKYICHYLGWLLGMKRPGYDLSCYSIHQQFNSTMNHMNSISNRIDIHYPKYPNGIHNKQILGLSMNGKRQKSDLLSKITVQQAETLPNIQDNQNLSTVSHSSETNAILVELRAIISSLSVVTDHIGRQEKHESESQDWKFVAMVIDRLCLILFTTFVVIFTLFFFLSASNTHSFQ